MSDTILITGSNGEVGHALVNKLSGNDTSIIAVDILDLDEKLLPKVSASIKTDITDKSEVERIILEHKPDVIFHLAARLSTQAEKDPYKAHDVNANGTANILEAATQLSISSGHSIKFIYPSTIAVYGFKTLEEKRSKQRVTENEFLNPITMYGINKLYGEALGIYYSSNFKITSDINRINLLDFRCLRFPGLISAETLPTGGTSDYASEMIHAAAKRQIYNCFVRPDSKIPFMSMPDAVDAICSLADVQREKLSQRVYNVSSFSLSAEEIFNKTKAFYPEAKIDYKVDNNRQKIVDSWPEDCDDSQARKDWGFNPNYNSETIFSEYLIPSINKKYSL